MDPNTSPIDWTSDDSANLRAFLRTPSGSRLLPKILETSPLLLPGGETNDILIRSGEVRAYMDVSRTILTLAYLKDIPEVVGGTTSYPDLEDDTKWDDGNKLKPNPIGAPLNTQPPTT